VPQEQYAPQLPVTRTTTSISANPTPGMSVACAPTVYPDFAGSSTPNPGITATTLTAEQAEALIADNDCRRLSADAGAFTVRTEAGDAAFGS
jgi:hypothetical protein